MADIDPYKLPPGTLYAPACERLRTDLPSFLGVSKIVREDESVGHLEPTRIQLTVAEALALFNWLMVVKHRQAKVSTEVVLWLLREVMYNEGIQGLLIAQEHQTAKVLWNRATYSYNALPPFVKIPLLPGTTAGQSNIRFSHNGGVQAISGGGGSAGTGQSPDRVHITEYPDMPDHGRFDQEFFPGINKRKNARIVMEHTPGLHGDAAHMKWLASLSGNGLSRFHPLFLQWWLDDSVVPLDDKGQVISADDLIPTQEELAMAERMPGITKGHFLFRRIALDNEFHGDVGLYEHKYPSSPTRGWVLHTSPAIPQEPIEELLLNAVQTKSNQDFYFKAPDPDLSCPYILVCDPAGFGETGDPSCIKVFNAWDNEEVYHWAGRIDPDRLADKILQVQEHFLKTRTWVYVESNAPACVMALKLKKCRNLYEHSAHHPGYWAGEQSNEEGLVELVNGLRKNRLRLRAQSSLHQLQVWDGKARKKRTKAAEGTHHFDEAVTIRIAAHVLFKIRHFGTRPSQLTQQSGMTYAKLRQMCKPEPTRKALGIPTC